MTETTIRQAAPQATDAFGADQAGTGLPDDPRPAPWLATTGARLVELLSNTWLWVLAGTGTLVALS